ncbi:MAG: aminomethyl-transferring glycine dehydrogenase [Nitratireductor sp.]|nr:aminomethyl-transferring glycine dehydrogenase [Nitratireductor sp.]
MSVSRSETRVSGTDDHFENRHIGPNASETREMLAAIGAPSMETLISRTVPASIRLDRPLAIPDGIGEQAALSELRSRLYGVTRTRAVIGQGYHGTLVPPVILRNLLENPGWYTSYTPYQPEISQGRLEMLFNFQTLVSELTGLPVANASLLDEGTAIAEAAGVAFRHHREKRTRIVVSNTLHPQSLDVVNTRMAMLGLRVETGEADGETAAVILQLPDTHGEIADPSRIIAQAKEQGALVIMACDPMALVLMETPASMGADICVGSMQRFGVPMGNGGPHAAYMAVSTPLTRLIPGRLVGQSIDAKGNPAYRLALQTREQHIRREKATSNICTAQALLANMSAAFAIWHGPEGLTGIATAIHDKAQRLAGALENAGIELVNQTRFDTVTVKQPGNAAAILSKAEAAGFVFRAIGNDVVSVAIDETVSESELVAIARVFNATLPQQAAPTSLQPRSRDFLTQEVFHAHRSETAMMRYLRMLMDKDLALDRAMIPLGSCTMKLNAAAEMIPVTWPEISDIHPFSPPRYLAGYKGMIDDLDRWLSEITGFAKVSFQPNAGSQGEYAGLMAIRRFHEANGGKNRNICLIPSSAHGTNPASAHMAGMEVVVVKCDENGNVDLADLTARAEEHSANLAALMITYPSTHGVFEEDIREICQTIHSHGGQVYLDGANLNALVGLARPGDFGGDVCHMNLHKTFCIPHGGGGPGVGPIGVAAHLVPYLPGHSMHGTDHAVSAAPEGSASILPITWMYIRMMGGNGLKRATEMAILNANYLARKLEPHFPVLYHGRNGFVAHECILDTRGVKESAHVSVEDIAKRLIDYGFHAPTMSWPVAGTLMIEPTESEPKAELDRFIDAMAAIRAEIALVENATLPQDDNPLVNAPHTAQTVTADEWNHAYSRSTAADPAGRGLASKYWPPVARVDNVHGDRNLVCSCPPMEAYAKAG